MENKEIECLQINLQKSKVATVEVSLSKLGDIYFIQEPYISRGRIRLIDLTKGSVISFKSKPRAAIFVRRGLEPWLAEEFTDEDLAVCTIKVEGKTCYFASAYMDLNLPIDAKGNLARLIDMCEVNGFPLVVSADSNAHSFLWGSDETNSRGQELEDLILEKGLVILSRGNEPTFSTVRAKSVIDITLVNKQAGDVLCPVDWRVRTEESHSDHKLISYTLLARSREEEKKV